MQKNKNKIKVEDKLLSDSFLNFDFLNIFTHV